MSILGNRFRAVAIVSIVLGLVAMLVSLEAYSVAKSIQAAPSVAATQRSTGENFNWKLGEVVNVKGNSYAYLGYETTIVYGSNVLYSLRLARWQNAWMELTYELPTTDFKSYYHYSNAHVNVTLSPYKLQVFVYNSDYLNATFFES